MSQTNQTCLLSWAVTTLLLCAHGLLCVANEADPPTASSKASRPCILLTNGNVLFGEAKQQGEWILILNGEGNVSQLPRQQVACWAPSIEDLYQYRVDRREAGDLEGLARDAQWCLDHELYSHAASLIREIGAIAPDNRLARSLEKQLRNRTDGPDDPAVTLPSVQSASHTASDGPSALNLADLKTFAGQVQPMLANRCGSCHSDPSDRKWSLHLPPHGARPSSRMTRENLQRSIEMIDANAPNQSLLLTKAVSPHGGVESPLDARDAKAIESLRFWIQRAAASMLTSPSELAADAPNDSFLPQSAILSGTTAEPNATNPSVFEAIEPPTIRSSEKPVQTKTPIGTTRLPEVVNPFDPEIFNRKFHPPQPPPDTATATPTEPQEKR